MGGRECARNWHRSGLQRRQRSRRGLWSVPRRTHCHTVPVPLGTSRGGLVRRDLGASAVASAIVAEQIQSVMHRLPAALTDRMPMVSASPMETLNRRGTSSALANGVGTGHGACDDRTPVSARRDQSPACPALLTGSRIARYRSNGSAPRAGGRRWQRVAECLVHAAAGPAAPAHPGPCRLRGASVVAPGPSLCLVRDPPRNGQILGGGRRVIHSR